MCIDCLAQPADSTAPIFKTGAERQPMTATRLFFALSGLVLSLTGIAAAMAVALWLGDFGLVLLLPAVPFWLVAAGCIDKAGVGDSPVFGSVLVCTFLLLFVLGAGALAGGKLPILERIMVDRASADR